MNAEGLFVVNFLKTVSTGPSCRSFPHVNSAKSLDEITVMNSAEEISKYSDNNSHYRSPTLARRAGVELDEPHPEKPAKKDKKWSLGGLFRRKKKEIESESTSDDDTHSKRGFLQRRKQKKEEKRKKRSNKALGHFDHIVVTPGLLQAGNITNGNKETDETGVLSDPTAGFASFIRGNSTRITSNNDRISSRESLNKNRQDLNQSRGSLGSGSLDSSGKKSRRERVKARAEAMRGRMKNDSSSEEGSQMSTASSVTRFKSDDSLSKKDSASNRKTRSARTERYNKRLTKEDESVLNKEAELEKQKVKSDVDVHQTKVQVNRWTVVDEKPRTPPTKLVPKPILNYSASNPLPQKPFIGISTIPPSHNVIHRANSNLSDNQRNYYNVSHKPANIYHNSLKSNQTDSLRNTQINYLRNDNRNDFSTDQRSFSYDCNINRSPTPNEGEIIHVQFPIGKPVPKPRTPSMINNHLQHYSNQSLQRITPPPPPPRDPQRRIYPKYENTRPMSYAFENGNQGRHGSVDRSSSVRSFNAPPPTNANLNRVQSFGWQTNYRSNSEDHITQTNQGMVQQNLITRPASASPDTTQQRFIRRHPTGDQYKYFAEKTPRSRRPIHIASTQPDQTYLSDSQVITRNYPGSKHPVQVASEFWRQKDIAEVRRKSQLFDANKDKVENKIQPASPVIKRPETKDIKKNFSVLSIPVKTADSLSSLSGNSDASPLCTKPFFEQNNESAIRPLSMVLEKAEHQDDTSKSKKDPPVPPVRRYSRQSSASSTENNWANDAEEVEKRKRRSSNLEDALDELEAIYKSLRLGDEDLLDRAEQRDVPTVVTQKLITKMPESYVNWGATRGAQSDSGYNYDMDTVDAMRKKRTGRRSIVPDRVSDDMAYRRLNKERPPPLDINAAMSQVSYLLATPLLGSASVDENDNEPPTNTDEPDITLDDVVYRNLKHTNNTLKIVDPQPPFGIPVGPITTASNSDYLHAVPDNKQRSRFIPQKSPDIVKDDLAFRSLRKDHPGTPDDFLNNNANKTDGSLKKKRAVRSISANIYNLMHRDTMKAAESSENEFDKAQSLTDIADVMDVAHQILKDKQRKISRKSTVSDTDTKPMRSNFLNSNIPTSTETLTESKSNLLNDINSLKDSDLKQKLQVYIPLSVSDVTVNQKPPLCPTPDRKSSKPPTKESTPIRVSPALEDNSLDKSQLEDLLTALAIEARETSEKLGNDLKLLDEQESRKCSPLTDLESSTSAIKSLDQKLSDIDAVSQHAKLCEKLLGCVVESTNLIGHTMPAVNVTKEREISETVDDISNEPVVYKSVANVIVTRKTTPPPIVIEKSEASIESDHDYENISREELEDGEISASPFEEHKTQLLADFEELKKDLFSDEDTLVSHKPDDQIVVSKDNSFQCMSTTPRPDDNTFRQLQDESCSEGEVCKAVDCLAYNSQDAVFDFSNEILLNPPLAFSTSAEIEIFDKSDSFPENNHEINQNYINSDSLGTKIDNNIPNFSPLPSPEIEYESRDDSDYVIQTYTSMNSRTDSEHSSGFHTESHGSSSADSSLNPILNDEILHEIHNLSVLETAQTYLAGLVFDSVNSNSDELISATYSTNCNPYIHIKASEEVRKDSERFDDVTRVQNSLTTTDPLTKSSKIDNEPVQTHIENRVKSMHDPCISSSNQSIPSTSAVESSVPTNPACSSRKEMSRRPSADDMKDTLESLPVAWYRDPAEIALACSYTLAFVHQLAMVDIVTLLGLLLAIISVFAALVL